MQDVAEAAAEICEFWLWDSKFYNLEQLPNMLIQFTILLLGMIRIFLLHFCLKVSQVLYFLVIVDTSRILLLAFHFTGATEQAILPKTDQFKSYIGFTIPTSLSNPQLKICKHNI